MLKTDVDGLGSGGRPEDKKGFLNSDSVLLHAVVEGEVELSGGGNALNLGGAPAVICLVRGSTSAHSSPTVFAGAAGDSR